MSEGDNLAVLRLMRSEGRITDEEYENLTKGLGSHEEPSFDDVPAADEAEGPVDQSGEESTPLWPPKLKEGLSAGYVTGLAVAAVALSLFTWLGIVPWLVSVPAILLIVTTLFDGWRLVTTVGALLWAGILVLTFMPSFSANAVPEQAPAGTVAPRDPYPEIAGSLSIYMDQVTDSWNGVESDARIVKGLTRHNETGEYDTFIYRFGDWGRLAGAFDPESEAIYALLATGQFGAPATEQLYIHLCFMVEPYSPECLDTFHEKGLEGGELADFADVTREVEWKLGEDTWRVKIDQNVLAIRVFGADAA